MKLEALLKEVEELRTIVMLDNQLFEYDNKIKYYKRKDEAKLTGYSRNQIRLLQDRKEEMLKKRNKLLQAYRNTLRGNSSNRSLRF